MSKVPALPGKANPPKRLLAIGQSIEDALEEFHMESVLGEIRDALADAQDAEREEPSMEPDEVALLDRALEGLDALPLPEAPAIMDSVNLEPEGAES